MERFRFTEVARYDTQQADRFLSDNGLEYKPVSTNKTIFCSLTVLVMRYTFIVGTDGMVVCYTAVFSVVTHLERSIV